MTTDLATIDYGQVQRVAHDLANAGDLIPKDYQGKPAKIVAAVMYGAELGLGPMSSLQTVVVVQGKPTLSASGWAALIRRAGHSFDAQVTDQAATVTGRRRDTGDEMTVTFTLDDADRAGLLKKGGGWKTYPKSMLFARALTQLARQLFADVAFGGSIYTAEELGADSDPEPVLAELVEGPVSADEATLRKLAACAEKMTSDEVAELGEFRDRRGYPRRLPELSQGQADSLLLQVATIVGSPVDVWLEGSRPDGVGVDNDQGSETENGSGSRGFVDHQGGGGGSNEPSAAPEYADGEEPW